MINSKQDRQSIICKGCIVLDALRLLVEKNEWGHEKEWMDSLIAYHESGCDPSIGNDPLTAEVIDGRDMLLEYVEVSFNLPKGLLSIHEDKQK